YNGLKFIKDSLEVTLGYKIENESREKINAALKQIWTVQDTLFKIREDMFRLQAENEQLRQQLKAKEDWENQKSQYQLEQTAGGAVVWVSTGAPKHYACPSCFSKATIQILQDRRVMAGVFDCPGCKVAYPINPYQETETVTRLRTRINEVSK